MVEEIPDKRNCCQKCNNLRGLYNTKCYLYTTLIFTCIFVALRLISHFLIKEDLEEVLSMSETREDDPRRWVRLYFLFDFAVYVLVGLDLLMKVCEYIVWHNNRLKRQKDFQ